MALRRSNDPLTGELRVPFRCVAPSRSSLNAGLSLLFLIIALAWLCSLIGIGFYYIHQQILCQFGKACFGKRFEDALSLLRKPCTLSKIESLRDLVSKLPRDSHDLEVNRPLFRHSRTSRKFSPERRGYRYKSINLLPTIPPARKRVPPSSRARKTPRGATSSPRRRRSWPHCPCTANAAE